MCKLDLRLHSRCDNALHGGSDVQGERGRSRNLDIASGEKDDTHGNLFREAKRIKQQQNIKWVTAFECVLRGDVDEQKTLGQDESQLEQLNRTILRIAETLEKIVHHLSAK